MTLFERLNALQLAVAAKAVAPTVGMPTDSQAVTDGLLWNNEYLNAGNILMRAGQGFPPVPAAEMKRLTRNYIVLHPRFRVYCRHTGGYDRYQQAGVLDDSVIVHLPAGEAHPLHEVDTLLPADWRTHAPALPVFGSEVGHAAYLPAFTQMGSFSGVFGLPFVHMADIIEMGSWFHTLSVLKGRIVAPNPADPRRRFCTPSTMTPGGAGGNIFNGVGSATPVWTVVPGREKSTLVRLAHISWNGGYFEWWHAGITDFRGRHTPNETRTGTQILNDLAAATGDDPFAGRYRWPDILRTVDLSENPVMTAFPYTITPKKAAQEFAPGTVGGDWRVAVLDSTGAVLAEARNAEGRLNVALQPGDYSIITARFDASGKPLGPETTTPYRVADAVVIEIAAGAVVTPA